jgi:hypothetical protein
MTSGITEHQLIGSATPSAQDTLCSYRLALPVFVSNLPNIHMLQTALPLHQKTNESPNSQPATITQQQSTTTMSTSKPLETFLNDYSSRLLLSSASKILTLDSTTHQTLTTWCKTTLSHVDQPTITEASDSTSQSTSWPHPEAAYTHIFATIQPDLKTSVKGLKGIHHSLLWKGVAVLLGPEGGEVAGEKVDVGKLVELGGFEPGKIRVVEVEGREICFAMKWDLLTA